MHLLATMQFTAIHMVASLSTKETFITVSLTGRLAAPKNRTLLRLMLAMDKFALIASLKRRLFQLSTHAALKVNLALMTTTACSFSAVTLALIRTVLSSTSQIVISGPLRQNTSSIFRSRSSLT